ncbi:MAG: ribokinase [Actinomycetia bacterium]|nr:ribokinase [Actinomycetes bacterium]
MTGAPGSVLVVGSVNADLVVGVDRRPAAGETVLGSDLATFPGGKGANQAVAAARLGASVAFLGRVGTDSFAAFLRANLDREGVATGQLLAVPGPSGVALITVDPAGDNSIIVAPGANARLTAQGIEAARAAFEAARVVSAQLEVPVAAVDAAARLAAATGARFILNLSPAREVPPALLAAADPLVVNEHEAAFLLGDGRPDSGRPGPAASAAALLARGPRSVVITLGADGAYAAGAGGGAHVRSPRVTVVDTTGAGDAFTGALAWRLSAGDTLPAAAALAVRVGAAAVTARGAQGSYPTPDQVPS